MGWPEHKFPSKNWKAKKKGGELIFKIFKQFLIPVS